MSSEPSIRFQELPLSLQAEATSVISEALMVEPGYMHIFPDEDERRLVLQGSMAANIDTALRKGKVWVALQGNQVLAVAIWLAPGEYPVDSAESHRVEHHSINLLSLDQEKQNYYNQYDLNCMHYFPEAPCWYLQAYGVHPDSQGKGVGSKFLRHMLQEIGNHDCYLETGTPANLGFYERQGFEIRDSAAQLVPNNGPTHWTMLRRQA